MTNIISSQVSPFFRATLTTPVNTVTGDGTVYNTVFDTLSVGSGYNTGTGIYTAPMSGDYLFSVSMYATGITSSHTAAFITLVSTTQTLQIATYNQATARTVAGAMRSLPAICVVRMSEGDTAYVSYQVSNGTKVINFGAGSYFQGVRLIS